MSFARLHPETPIKAFRGINTIQNDFSQRASIGLGINCSVLCGLFTVIRDRAVGLFYKASISCNNHCDVRWNKRGIRVPSDFFSSVWSQAVCIGLALLANGSFAADYSAYVGFAELSPHNGSRGEKSAIGYIGAEFYYEPYFVAVEVGENVEEILFQDSIQKPLEHEILANLGFGFRSEVGQIFQLRLGGGVNLSLFEGEESECQFMYSTNGGTQCIDPVDGETGFYTSAALGLIFESRYGLDFEIRHYYLSRDLQFDSVSITYKQYVDFYP